MLIHRLPLLYQYEMSAQEALFRLRQNRAISKEPARQLYNLFQNDCQIPEQYHPLLELVFLVQTRAYSNLLQ
jgi:hypothetical protein